MNEDKRIQELLSEKMQQANAPVDPAIWQGIQSALPAAGSGAAAAASGFKLGAFGWASIATAVIGISTAVMVFNQKEIAPQEQTVEVQPENIPVEAVQEEQPQKEETSIELDETATTQTRVERAINQDPVADTIEWEATSVQAENIIDEQAVEEAAQAPTQTPPTVDAQIQQDDTPETVSSAPVQDPNLTASFDAAKDPFEDFVITFTPSFKQGSAYFWIFGDGATSYEMSPVHQFEEEGMYDVLLNVTDENGFSETFDQTISVRKPALLILPNTFTPNGDGYNDLLNPAERSQNVTILSMQVYSLDGNLLFEQSGDGTGWDGNVFGGEPAKEGDYILIVTGKTQFGENIDKQRKVFLQRN